MRPHTHLVVLLILIFLSISPKELSAKPQMGSPLLVADSQHILKDKMRPDPETFVENRKQGWNAQLDFQNN
jgi:hypothetical protein